MLSNVLLDWDVFYFQAQPKYAKEPKVIASVESVPWSDCGLTGGEHSSGNEVGKGNITLGCILF